MKAPSDSETKVIRGPDILPFANPLQPSNQAAPPASPHVHLHVLSSAAETRGVRVDLAAIGDGVIAADGGGGVIFMNAVAQALTGWPEELPEER